MDDNGKNESRDNYYVCLFCKQQLIPITKGLCCQRDGVEYPVKNGIVDLVVEEFTKSVNLFLKHYYALNLMSAKGGSLR